MGLRAKIEEISDSENPAGTLQNVLSTAMQDSKSILKKVSGVDVPDIAKSVSSTMEGLINAVI